MTTVEPLKSVISIIAVDDTSLALPSVNQYKSGQQRVLEQVQTIRRTKSRQSSSRSASASLSPTSPLYDSVFTDASKSSTANGSVFFGNGFSKALSVNRQVGSNVKASTVKRHTAASNYQYERSYAPVGSKVVGRMSTARSMPDLARYLSMPKQSVPPQTLFSTKSSYRTERENRKLTVSTASKPLLKSQPQRQSTMNGTSQNKTNTQFVCSQVDSAKTSSKPPVTKSAQKSKRDSSSNDKSGVADITMKEAVEYLSNKDETYQHCGASYIQHNSYIDEKAKEEVLKLNGIPPLVALLRSPNLQVHQTASAALRNLSFKSNSNKEEIHHCGGITQAVDLLNTTDSAEIQKQLTGLLWNLSSVDSLKPDLLKSALPVLMERVILPYTTGPDRTNNESEAFFHTTGCLRNLSSAKQSNRQAMRKCRGLIDSLVRYVQDSVEAGRPDNKSLENCVCILHNLTFQLEAEAPALFSRITALSKPVSGNPSQGDTGPISCFSPQSKSLEHKHHFDFPIMEDPQPNGAGWLIHSKTLQTYLSLLESSQQEETQEACCGTLQNLTAHEGIVSSVMSQMIVQKLNGMKVIAPLLKSKKVNLQRNAVALVGNLTKNPNLHTAIARKALPELLGILSAGTKEGNESDDTLAMACKAANCLLMKEPEMGRHLLNNNLINSLNDLSQNGYFPKSKKAAGLLLYNLWSEKDLQSFLKKQGMNKSSFVNDVTTAAHKSVQIVD